MTNNLIDFSPEELKILFANIGFKEGLQPVAIEKDWWITQVLKVVFSLSFKDHMVFKGGTSLSKAWAIIERFSEDIDVAIDRRYLGFEGELSKTQVKKLRKASCTFVSTLLKNEIVAKVDELKIHDVTIRVQEFSESDTDPLIIELAYNSLFGGSPYIQPRVLIEVGARSLMEPTENRGIQSLIGAHTNKSVYKEDVFSVPTVLPKRTLLEKAFLLHEEFQKPAQHIRTNRLTRHLYDLDRLMASPHGAEALKDTALYKAIIDHRQRYTPVRGIDYANHSPDKISFVPPASIIKAWEDDYITMLESMIYGDKKNFDDLISSIRKINEAFRDIKL